MHIGAKLAGAATGLVVLNKSRILLNKSRNFILHPHFFGSLGANDHACRFFFRVGPKGSTRDPVHCAKGGRNERSFTICFRFHIFFSRCRNVLGTKNLGDILSDREQIANMMQSTLDEATDPWGVKVERVEV